MGDVWPSNKVTPIDADCPPVKPDLSFNDSIVILSKISRGSQSLRVITACQDTGLYWSQNYCVFAQYIGKKTNKEIFHWCIYECMTWKQNNIKNNLQSFNYKLIFMNYWIIRI